MTPIDPALLAKLRSVFFHRTDTYAEMWQAKDGRIGYSPVCQYGKHWECGRQDLIMPRGRKCGDNCRNFTGAPLTGDVLRSHLQGRVTLGSYLVDIANRANLAAIDCDIDKSGDPIAYRSKIIALATLVHRSCDHFGLHHALEDSGSKGYHIWIPLAEPMPAAEVQQLGEIVAASATRDEEIEGVHAEVFPKQGGTEDFGNLIKVPFGVHLRTGNRCLLVDPDTFTPYSDAQQMAVLLALEPNTADEVRWILEQYQELAPRRRRSPREQEPGTEAKGGLPCFKRMMHGVEEGCRDEVAFRLAIHLHKQGVPQELAETMLTRWDENYNDPPIGEDTVLGKVDSAYTGKYGLGCSSPLIRAFCDPACPVAKKRASGDAADPAKLKEVIQRQAKEIRELKAQVEALQRQVGHPKIVPLPTRAAHGLGLRGIEI